MSNKKETPEEIIINKGEIVYKEQKSVKDMKYSKRYTHRVICIRLPKSD